MTAARVPGRQPVPPPVVPELPLWMSVERAARLLDLHPTTFRRHLERNVVRLPDGSIEARFDDIVARKLGNRWRVQLGPRWRVVSDPDPTPCGTPRSARPEHAGKPGGDPGCS